MLKKAAKSIPGLIFLVVMYIAPVYGQGVPTPLFGSNSAPGISTSDTTPLLRWTVVPGAASYDIDVWDLASSERIIDQDGRSTTSFTTPVLVRGRIYAWNVRACNAAGCGNFSDYFYFAVTGSAPDAPDPMFGSEQPPGPSISDTTPLLQWGSVSGGSRYDIEVFNAASDERVVSVEGRTARSYTTPDLPGGRNYRWRVRACGNSGCGIYSNAFYFRVVDSTPGVPNLLFGSSGTPGTSINDTTPRLRWTAVSGATSYDIDVRDLTSNALVVNVDRTASVSYTTQVLSRGRSYSWIVRACNNSGCGNYSSPRYFRITGSFLGIPVLLFGSARAPGTATGDSTPQLSWNAVSGAASYDIDIVNASTGSLVVNTDGWTSTVYTSPELDSGRSYRWNVRACNSGGCGRRSADSYFSIGGVAAISPITTLLLGE